MRILIVDDSPFDRELTIRMLQEKLPDATFVEINRKADFDAAMARGDFEIVLLDYMLKWSNGLELLKQLRQQFPDLPILMVTDTGNEEIAAEGMKSGLNDYVLKRHMQRLPFAVLESLKKVQLLKEHQALAEQVQQAQKMESLSLLVSGVAHDFNNLLGGIMGYAQQGLSRLNQDDTLSLYGYFTHIHEIARQGTKLTRQLLAFARQQPFKPDNLDLNTVISHLLDILTALLTTNIKLEFVSDNTLNVIYADISQIEQVVLNLGINARDAMPAGGKLLLQTRNVQLDEKEASLHANGQAGAYVLLTVTDTGTGIDEQTRKRLFEPFFTTKEPGKGTGLGLSVVHGIMTQHHGFIGVDSTPGKGTTFKLYFPAVEQAVTPTKTAEVPPVQGGTETILVVEDDPDIYTLMIDVLRDYGYTALMAHNGEEGLRLFKQHSSSIALVIADLVMPKMRGAELYNHIHQLSPTMHFLFVSGYESNQLDQDVLRQPGVAFLPKPFDLDELMIVIRKIID